MLRALHEFVAYVRRAGVRVSTAEALDAVRVVRCLGLSSRADLRAGLSAALAKDARDVRRVQRLFDTFFSEQGAPAGDLYARLREAGFQEDELDVLRALIDVRLRTSPAREVFAALVASGPALEQLLRRAARAGLEGADDPARVGFVSMRLLEAARVPRAETELAGMRGALRGALGARGDALADALWAQLSVLRDEARRYVSARARGEGEDAPLAERPFSALTPEERARVERAVRSLAQRLLGRAAVRARRARRGRIDVRRTLRGALRTGGAPIVPHFRRRAPERPKLVLLCDVSESMHASARFMLLFVHTVQRLFRDARSFVFVSDVAEATAAFRGASAERAIELAYRGALVNVADNSHYRRAFEGLLAQHAGALSRDSTLLVLGDARTNHFDPGTAALGALRARVRRVVWLTPEPESAWDSGDSALLEYRRIVDQTFPVHDLASLEAAARAIVPRR